MASKAAGFRPERHEGGNYIVVVERLESKTPVVASRPVHEDKSVLESTNGKTISKGDVNVDDVEIFRQCAINWLSTCGLGNCCIRAD